MYLNMNIYVAGTQIFFRRCDMSKAVTSALRLVGG